MVWDEQWKKFVGHGVFLFEMTCLPVAYPDCSSPFYNQNFTGDTSLKINGDRNLKITRFFEKEEHLKQTSMILVFKMLIFAGCNPYIYSKIPINCNRQTSPLTVEISCQTTIKDTIKSSKRNRITAQPGSITGGSVVRQRGGWGGLRGFCLGECMDQHEQWAVDPGYLLHISWVVPSSQDVQSWQMKVWYKDPRNLKNITLLGRDWHPGKGLRHNNIRHYTLYTILPSWFGIILPSRYGFHVGIFTRQPWMEKVRIPFNQPGWLIPMSCVFFFRHCSHETKLWKVISNTCYREAFLLEEIHLQIVGIYSIAITGICL